MAQERVVVVGHVPRAPDQVWAVLRDFGGAWHPAMAWVRAERGGKGALIRAFGVAGEATVYREQRVWFSDSGRALAYRHLQGIRDVERYDAGVAVTPAEGGSTVTWTAELTAPAARAPAIAEGTRAIFEMGIAALGGVAAAGVPAWPAPPAVEAADIRLDGMPHLALLVTPDLGRDTLCLFLHGIGGGRRNWQAQLRAVGGVMRAAALDLRGYGDSALGPGQSTVEDYCADIQRVAKVLGARRLVLCGLSYGSWIATSFAMRHPQIVAGLVLSGGCTGMSEAGEQERTAFRQAREVPLNAGQSPADFAPAVVSVLAGPRITPEARAELLATMAAVPAATYRDALSCFTNPRERFDFARLDMPVLLMTGASDRLAPPHEIAAVALRIRDQAEMPDVQFEVIAGAGHVCNIEAPDDYNSHLVPFLQRLTQ